MGVMCTVSIGYIADSVRMLSELGISAKWVFISVISTSESVCNLEEVKMSICECCIFPQNADRTSRSIYSKATSMIL